MRAGKIIFKTIGELNSFGWWKKKINRGVLLVIEQLAENI
jgi:hypothetical protein